MKLGQRLVLSGAALDSYRQKLGGMLQDLRSLSSKVSWTQPDLEKFSELYGQFQELAKAVPPEDNDIQALWGQIGRELTSDKPLADRLSRELEARRQQSTEQLGQLYVGYMTLQLCSEHFPQFADAKSQLREFLKSKEATFPHDVADKLWNTTADKFQQTEAALDRAGNVQLYAACDLTSKQVPALVTPSKVGSFRDPNHPGRQA